MLDQIIISYKLTTNLSVTYQEYIQYPVDNTYNTNTCRKIPFSFNRYQEWAILTTKVIFSMKMIGQLFKN